MPEARTKPAARKPNGNGSKPPAKPQPTSKPAEPTSEVPYPEVEILCCWAKGVDGGIGPLTAAQMRAILGWETERDYCQRLLKEGKITVPEEGKFRDEDWEVMRLKNRAGERVVCWKCTANRPFDAAIAEEYVQDILTKNWAGPTSMPGETINGETIIIGKSGQSVSCQKRGVALIWAEEDWHADEKWRQFWPDGPPVMDALVVRGVSESPKVLKTVDNVQPRSLMDVFYTSDEFAGKQPVDRRELSKYMAAAVDFLWRRTGAGKSAMSPKQTHSASIEFAHRHGRLKRMVKHVWEENKERAISKLKLSPGKLAALAYLMGCSKTPPGSGYAERRDEAVLDFSLQDRAEEFVVMLAQLAGRDSKPLRDALADAVGENVTEDAPERRQMAVLALAWHRFRQDHPVRPEDLKLTYVKDVNGITRLESNELHNLGGIDVGLAKCKLPDEEPSEAEIEEEKRRLRAEQARKAAERAAGKGGGDKAGVGTPAAMIKEQIDAVRAKHPGRLLLFKAGEWWRAWENNAHVCARVLDGPPWAKVKRLPSGLDCLTVPHADLEASLKKLFAKGYKVALCNFPDGAEPTVEHRDDPDAKPAPASAAKPKPQVAPKPAAPADHPTADVNGTPLQTTANPRPRKGPQPLRGGL